MVATGCFLAVAGDVIALVRDKTLFVLTPAQPERVLHFQLLEEAPIKDVVFKATDDNADDEAQQPQQQQHAVTVNCITGVEFFAPRANALALLVLVDERKLVHYDIDIATNSVAFQSLRVLPRNAVCMSVARLTDASNTQQHVVVAGVKTGEALAMPFPDITRDVQTLLGHTTSMIVHMAVSHNSDFLLTADRDEKVRVSHFPRTSLVQSYCLGHTSSLTKVATSTQTPALAVSTALDNTLKLWDMTSGTLLDSMELLTGEAPLSSSLLTPSLAIDPVSNVVAVALDNRVVRLFAIVADATNATAAAQLKPLTLAVEMQQQLDAHAPTDVAFLSTGKLVVALRNAPFAAFYTIATTEEAATLTAAPIVAATILKQVHDAFNTIEIATNDNIDDDFDGGIKKKKVRTAFDYKTKVAALSQPPQQQEEATAALPQ